MLEYFLRPVRFDLLAKYVPAANVAILDIGCGNHSPSLTKRFKPFASYHGLDLTKDYNNDRGDLECMDRFFQADLETSDLNEIPDDHYDCIILSHVVEHLHDGLGVIEKLARKLKHGGILYVETPAPRSIAFPHMKGTLNFWDDATHVRVYTPEELVPVIAKAGYRILHAGTRRSWKRVLLFPVHVVYSLWKYRYLSGTVFWDILGFAHVIIARRE